MPQRQNQVIVWESKRREDDKHHDVLPLGTSCRMESKRKLCWKEWRFGGIISSWDQIYNPGRTLELKKKESIYKVILASKIRKTMRIVSSLLSQSALPFYFPSPSLVTYFGFWFLSFATLASSRTQHWCAAVSRRQGYWMIKQPSWRPLLVTDMWA